MCGPTALVSVAKACAIITQASTASTALTSTRHDHTRRCHCLKESLASTVNECQVIAANALSTLDGGVATRHLSAISSIAADALYLPTPRAIDALLDALNENLAINFFGGATRPRLYVKAQLEPVLVALEEDGHAPAELHERGSGRSGCLSTGSAALSRSTASPRASASVQ